MQLIIPCLLNIYKEETMIDIESINSMIRIINGINFMVSDIIKEIDRYVLLDKVGQYDMIYSEDQFCISNDGLYVLIRVPCHIEVSSCTPWIRDETLSIESRLFDNNIDINYKYQYFYSKKLKEIKLYIDKEKKEIESKYKNVLGAEHLIESYIKKGLIIETK